MTRQPDLFGAAAPPKPSADTTVSLRLRLVEQRPQALLLETDTLPITSAWVPAPPVTSDPDHDGFFLIPRKMAIEKGLM